VSSNVDSKKCGYLYPSDNRQCRAWAIRGSDPARCASHRQDGGPRTGAPKGNTNRQSHGFYASSQHELRSIDDVLSDMLTRQSQLSAYIEEKSATGEIEIPDMVKLLSLHGQNASRIGRLLRDQRALSGESADGIAGAIATALDELSVEWGVEL